MLPLLVALVIGCSTEGPTATPLPQAETASTAPAPQAERVAAPASRDVQVADGWVRMMPPGSTTTAAFMTLRNGGTAPTAVVGASSEAATSVELHTHVQDGEVARMRQVDRFDLDVGQDRALQPAGDHLMLLGLHKDLEVGQAISLTLRFADGSEQQVDLPVERQPEPGQGQAAAD